MSIGETIKRLRESMGLSQKELAQILKISNQRLSNWEKDINQPNADFIAALCDVLNVNADDLLGTKKATILDINQAKLFRLYDQLSKKSKDIVMDTAQKLLELEKNQTTLIMPYLFEGQIPTTELDYYPQAAGMGGGQYVTDAIPEKINVPSFEVPPKADFIIQVVGDSMEPSFKTGDKLFIESTSVLRLGDIGVFNYLGEQLVKEFGKGELISHNKSYEPIRVNEKELYIQGRVLGKV